jgi:hypothetical protein
LAWYNRRVNTLSKVIISSLALPFLLVGCGGNVPVQSQNLGNFSTPLTVPGFAFTPASTAVAYSSDAQIKDKVLFVKARIYADVTYTAKTTTPITVNFYARSSAPSECLAYAPYFVCLTELASRKIGSATLIPNVPQSVTLEGKELDDAVHLGSGFVGLQLAAGTAYTNDTLEFKNVVAQALL